AGGPDGKDGGIDFAARGDVGRIVFEIDGAGGAVILDGGMDAFGRRGVALVFGLEFGHPTTGAGRVAFGVVVFGARLGAELIEKVKVGLNDFFVDVAVDVMFGDDVENGHAPNGGR